MFKKTIIIVALLLTGIFGLNDSAFAAVRRGYSRAHHFHFAALAHRRGHRISYGIHIASGGRRSRHHFARFARRARSEQAANAFERSAASHSYAWASAGGYVQTGRASFYTGGGRTASGGGVGAATCAHRSLPFGTRVLVTNLTNRRQAILTVNDRGPFVRGRVVDVSRGAAGMLGMIGAGVASVRVEVIGRAS